MTGIKKKINKKKNSNIFKYNDFRWDTLGSLTFVLQIFTIILDSWNVGYYKQIMSLF